MSFQQRKEPSGATYMGHTPDIHQQRGSRTAKAATRSDSFLLPIYNKKRIFFNKTSVRIRPDVVFMRVESPVDIANHSSTRFSVRFSAAVSRKTVETFEHVLESALECMAATAAWLDETSATQTFNTVHKGNSFYNT
jgi:hypothetical protein